MKYAEILKDRVRYIGEAPKLPEFRLPLFAVDLTGVSPLPQEGWLYDSGVFTPAERPIPPPPQESLESKIDRVLAKLSTIESRLPR